jgi:hypothetical protein
MLIDFAIHGDRNVIENEGEKSLKYKYLITEIQHMWNVKAKVIAVVIWATGNVSIHSDHTRVTYQESANVGNCKKRPYWALHTYYGKCYCKSKGKSKVRPITGPEDPEGE